MSQRKFTSLSVLFLSMAFASTGCSYTKQPVAKEAESYVGGTGDVR